MMANVEGYSELRAEVVDREVRTSGQGRDPGGELIEQGRYYDISADGYSFTLDPGATPALVAMMAMRPLAPDGGRSNADGGERRANACATRAAIHAEKRMVPCSRPMSSHAKATRIRWR
jgi:hypothetical protein